MLKKALTSASRSAISTAAGVSIITPTGTDSAARTPASPERLALLEHDRARLLHLLHQGDQRQHELDVAIRPRRGGRARIWGRKTSGSSRQTRIERQPRNGLASAGALNATGNLSPPRSYERMMTVWPWNAVATRRK